MSVNALFQETAVAGVEDVKPARLTVSGLDNEEIWLLDIKGGTTPNYQLMYSVGNEAFLNAFNQRFSIFTLSGVHILATCEGEPTQGEPPFLTFYKNNNIVSNATPVSVAYSGLTMSGYMVGLKLGSYNQEGIDGYQFTLEYLGKIDTVEAASKEVQFSQSTSVAVEFEGVTFGGGTTGDISATLQARLDEQREVRSGRLKEQRERSSNITAPTIPVASSTVEE